MSGRKQWAAFERLTAADVNEFLSDQTIMRFATAAARDAAIPAPAVGMVSAVAASPDVGAPRRWDGSAWVLLSAGVPNPNPWAAGDPGDMSTVGASLSTTSDVWAQVTAGLGQAVQLLAVAYGSTGSDLRVEIGTGSASSEATRFAWRQRLPSGSGSAVQVFPWPVWVPASTRVAVRTSVSVTSLNPVLLYVPVASAPQFEAGFSTVSNTALSSNTAWQQIAATPPKAGGVEVVGFAGAGGLAGERVRFGVGAASSEIPVTGWFDTRTGPWVVPFTWPAGARLAVQAETAPGGGAWGGSVLWKDEL